MEGWVSIVVNFLLFLLKGIFGFLTGSVPLIADAFHTLSDVSTSIVIVASFKIAKRPSDASHPFGHGRMEAIASVLVAVLLLVAGIEIFLEAVERIIHPKGFNASWLVIGIIGFTVIAKELLARFSQELGRRIGSAALEADFWHHRTDAISSVLVIFAFIGQRFGLSYLDGVFGVIVAGMIGYTGFEIVRKGIDDLLGKRPSKALVRKVKDTVRELPEVIDVHDVIIHMYGQQMVISLHIEVSEEMSLKSAHTLAEEVEELVNDKFRTHATVHIDPINLKDPEIRKMRECVNELIEKCEGSCSFHDLRTVGESGAKNVVFDLQVDPRMKQKEIEGLQDGLRRALLSNFPSVAGVVIEVEPMYAL
jgi:cation diffusion facilitator family transporter